ncbi:MAG: DNA topoisomerase IV subunit B [Pseudomonadota bacterium]|nr:DNA topoisomerase IV subunit B [Pseudomonadota bacterium]
MPKSYNSDAIEVLKGLEPVQKRPGMYTDTTRPNHLAQEVIDNSVDEALGGFADQVSVILHEDNSLEVIDNGRGMPVDIHPEYQVSGVELILTRLHAGGKFSGENYKFSGGLHGVGVSVVNALSKRVEVNIRRDQSVHEIAFEHGAAAGPLEITGSCGKKNTGTSVRFWVDPSYFDTDKFSITKLCHVLKAKAVLCSGLRIKFENRQAKGDQEKKQEWYYEHGLQDYLLESLASAEKIPQHGYLDRIDQGHQAAEWVVIWLSEPAELLAEAYVNLIPTAQGGTHVNGLRTGLLEAIKEYCEFRNLLPRGLKLTADDIWDNCCYVLSLKMQDPQFAGQTKERLSSRSASGFISTAVKDSFSLWLNTNTEAADAIAQQCISKAQARTRKAQKVVRKKVTQGPALPGKLADCTSSDPAQSELFLVEGDSAGGSAKMARNRETQAIMPLRGKILNTWEVDSNQVLGSQEVHDIAVAIGLEPGQDDLSNLRYHKVCILADADSDGLHIATLLCALFVKHFPDLVAAGHVFVAMPPLFRVDIRKDTYYALDESEKQAFIEKAKSEGKRATPVVTRFKGLGEMSAGQLRETTMLPDTRRLVQLQIDDAHSTHELLNMLLGKKRASDRKAWLETKGNLAEV